MQNARKCHHLVPRHHKSRAKMCDAIISRALLAATQRYARGEEYACLHFSRFDSECKIASVWPIFAAELATALMTKCRIAQCQEHSIENPSLAALCVYMCRYRVFNCLFPYRHVRTAPAELVCSTF